MGQEAPLIWLRPLLRKAIGAIDAEDIQFYLGLALLTYGARLIYLPATYLVPGAALIWIALPPKPFPILFTRGKDPS